MSDATTREEWPQISRGGRGGNSPTEIQLKIIECLRRWGMPPFGEASTEEEILEHMTDVEHAKADARAGLASYHVAGLTVETLEEELYDAVLAGWVRMTPYGYDAWERPRPERTDLPVEDRAHVREGFWTDTDGNKHFGNMAYEGDDQAMADAMAAIEKEGNPS